MAKSVIELRERVKEHVVFTDWDIFWDLGRVNLEVMGQWPQISSSGRLEPPLEDQPGEQNAHLMEAATQTASPVMPDVELTRRITLPDRMEEENWYVLVITASRRQLNLGAADDDLRVSNCLTWKRYLPEPTYGSCFFGTNEKDHQPSRHNCGGARSHGPHGVN